MPARDISLRQLGADLMSAFALLTRLPQPAVLNHRADAAWAWPVVGAVVAALAGAVAAASLALGVPAGPAAGLLLITATLLTGALHEDGLADTADGLFGASTPERRLAIMKDSHIGSYGTLALVLVTLTRWSALTVALSGQHWGLIIAAGALGRAPMAVIIAALPNARGSGLAQTVGRPSAPAAATAATLALIIALAFAGMAGLVMALAAGFAAYGVAALAKTRIGGQTGDILGAAQQLAELAALCAGTALLS